MKYLWKFFRLIAITTIVVTWYVISNNVQAGQNAAYKHLNKVMDRFNRTFNVYTDLRAAGNHFAARCATTDKSNISGIAFNEAIGEIPMTTVLI